MKQGVLAVLTVLIGLTGFAQLPKEEQHQLDSVNNILANATNDTTVASNLIAVTDILYISNIDTLKPLCERALAIVAQNFHQANEQEKKSYLYTQANSLINLGYYYDEKGKVQKAISTYLRALTILKQTDNKLLLGDVYNNLAFSYDTQGDIEAALENYLGALKVYEETKDSSGIAFVYSNLGSMFHGQGEPSKSLDYSLKALDILVRMKNDYGIANVLSNIGTSYYAFKQPEKALEYYKKSLKIKLKLNDKSGIAISYNNIGYAEQALENYNVALDFFQKSLSLRKEIGSKVGESESLRNMAEVYIKIGDYSNAEKFGLQSLAKGEELGSPDEIWRTATVLKKVFEKEEKFEKAYELYNTEVTMRDSVLNEGSRRSAIKMGIRYEFEKQQFADSLAHAQETQLKDLEIKEHKAQLEREETQRFALYGGVLLIALVAGVLYRGFVRKKKDHEIILEQKKNIEIQKQLFEQKNEEITDSILYAERIQHAVLKSEEHESKHLPEHFILFKPKDIVSGDFYWAKEINNSLYLAVADCTGHGVPGAFMSMLGIAFLNDTISDLGAIPPSELLDILRERIVKELSNGQNHGDTKDGMDMSIVKINMSTISNNEIELEWAGANNPLYVISNKKVALEESTEIKELAHNGFNLTELKPDKEPVAYYENQTPFTNHKLKICKGDSVYLFSDGYADQFGGPKGKKLMYKPFKKMLMEAQELSLDAQKKKLEKAFADWQGDLEQIDDVCVLGIRL